MHSSQIDVAFVSTNDDPHSERFNRFFEESGLSYLRVFVEVDENFNASTTIDAQVLGDWPAIVRFLEERVSLVVSGPLDSCSSKLSDGRFRHVGVSWATDIMGAKAGGVESLRSLENTTLGLDAVLTDNYASENALIALGVNSNAIVRFPWGPTSTLQNKPPNRASRGLPEERTLILHARTLEPHYEPELFVDAIERLHPVHPGVAGVMIEKGSQVTVMKELISDRALEDLFFWQPAESPHRFPDALQIFDAVVMAPVTDGTSVTLLDAMQRKVPVICSLTNGSSEWIMDGVSGWTFPTSDSSALFGALKNFLESDPQLVRIITGNAHRLVVQRANWEQSKLRLSSLLRGLLTKA